MGDENMRRIKILLLPLVIAVASCGTTAQYSQQRFSDGIYSRQLPVYETRNRDVHIYSKEDFQAMAAQNIAMGRRDTVYVVVKDNDNCYNDWYSPWYFGFGAMGPYYGGRYWNSWDP